MEIPKKKFKIKLKGAQKKLDDKHYTPNWSALTEADYRAILGSAAYERYLRGGTQSSSSINNQRNSSSPQLQEQRGFQLNSQAAASQRQDTREDIT